MRDTERYVSTRVAQFGYACIEAHRGRNADVASDLGKPREIEMSAIITDNLQELVEALAGAEGGIR